MKESFKKVAILTLLVLSSVSLFACARGGVHPGGEEEVTETTDVPPGRFFGYQHGETEDGQTRFFHSFGAPLVEEKRESANDLYKIK
jgi:hypothetical protein